MVALLEIFNDGEKYIRLSNHSIKDTKFNITKDTSLKPRLNTSAKNLIIEGLINTDLSTQPPIPIVDEYGDQIYDEDGNPKYDLLEFDSVRKLVRWAVIPEYLECYRDVTITLTDSSGDLTKEKEYENMFVVSYNEKFDNSHGNGVFRLHLRERENLKAQE